MASIGPSTFAITTRCWYSVRDKAVAEEYAAISGVIVPKPPKSFEKRKKEKENSKLELILFPFKVMVTSGVDLNGQKGCYKEHVNE